MTDFTKRSDHEAKTHELFSGWDTPDEYFSTAQIIKMVFRAMWYSSLEVERISLIGSAMACYEGMDQGDVQIVLTKMVRDKVLRIRVVAGKRLYEINY